MMLLPKVKPKHILVCRNDAIGDTVLALPCCGLIKKYFPDTKISFLGNTYTKDVVSISNHIDDFINYDEIHQLNNDELKSFFKERKIDTALLLRMEKHLSILIKNSGIRFRIGNFHFMRHLSACNRFVSFGHKQGLNEAQLNLKMLKPMGIKEIPGCEQLVQYYGISKIAALNTKYSSLLSKEKFNLILHPTTTGNAPAWPEKYFQELISRLDKNRYKIFVSGSSKDRELIEKWNLDPDHIENIAGQTNLSEFISFIHQCDGLVAGSTGPLHLAAALGKCALGLYPSLPERKSPERWGPVGKNAFFIESHGESLEDITVTQVEQVIYKTFLK